MEISRRKFLNSLILATAGSSLGVAGVYQYSRRIAPKRLTVEHVTIPIKNLGNQFEGFKIVHLSDLHLHPYTQIELIQHTVSLTNSLKPDLIVLTGDYVFSSAESIFELAPVLAQLDARHGIYAVLGNHDLWTDEQIVSRGFEKIRMPLLKNALVPITIGGSSIYLAGLEDGWSGRPQLRKTLDGVPERAVAIVLLHEPDFIDVYSLDNRVALQLSGHSHGGQVRFPGIGAVALPNFALKYDCGLYSVNNAWLYTNRGIGVTAGIRLIGNISAPPVRFNCPPEITEITLAQSISH